MNRRSLGEDFPLEADSLSARFLDVEIDPAGAREALGAGLPTEDGEAENLEGALASIGRDCAHFGALEGLDRRRFAGLQAKA